jgi:hypothetical protein
MSRGSSAAALRSPVFRGRLDDFTDGFDLPIRLGMRKWSKMEF